VKLSDESLAVREYITHPGAAMIIPVLDNGQIVLTKQFRYALKKVFLEFPAGKIDKNEDVLETAHRELAEETGYTTKHMKWLTTIHPVIGYSDERIEIFLATQLVPGAQKLDPGEMVEVENYSLQDLLGMVREQKITDVKTQIGVFWLQQFLENGWGQN